MKQATPAHLVWSSHYADLTLAAVSRVPVLITAGGSAERYACARFIHNTSSLKKYPFVSVSCDPTLHDDASWNDLASRRGSAGLRSWLTRARTGTLFIDRVEHMSLELQQQLSEALDHSIDSTANPLADVRLITGAGSGWSTAFDSRRFSERLYYRLNVMRINYTRTRHVESVPHHPHPILEEVPSFGVPQGALSVPSTYA